MIFINPTQLEKISLDEIDKLYDSFLQEYFYNLEKFLKIYPNESLPVLIYAIKSSFFTLDQMVDNFYLDKYYGKLCTRINRMVTEDVLKKEHENKNTNTRIVFYITEKGQEKTYEFLCEFLKKIEHYIFINTKEDNTIEKSILNMLKVILENWNIVSSRCVLSSGITYYNHQLSIRDFLLHLLSNPLYNYSNTIQEKPYFNFELEVPFRHTGELIKKEQRYVKNFSFKQVSVRADALLRCRVMDIDYTFYIEQDTGNQYKDKLIEKMDRYIKHNLLSAYKIKDHSLIFSVGYDELLIGKDVLKPNLISVSAIKKLSNKLPIFAYYLHMDKKINIVNVSLGDILSEYNKLKMFLEVSGYPTTWCDNEIKTITMLLERFEILYVKDLPGIIEKFSEENIVIEKTNKLNHIRKRFVSRRRYIFNTFLEYAPLSSLFLQGLSIYTINTKEPYMHINNLMLGLGSEFDIYKLVGILQDNISFGDNAAIRSVSYHNLTSTYENIGQVFKNLFKLSFDDFEYNVCIENVSDDIGGLYRVLYYLNQPTYEYIPNMLIIIYEKENLEEFKKLFMETAFYKAGHKSDNFMINFIDYDKEFTTYDDMFNID